MRVDTITKNVMLETAFVIGAAQLLAAAVERPIRWPGSLAALAEQNLRGVTSAADRAR